MAYRIPGLSPAPFQHLFGLAQGQLAEQGALRMAVTSCPGFPCRVTLRDAEVGSNVLLLNHVSHDVRNPYRASHAIFIQEDAEEAAEYVDRVPPVFATRRLSMRGFDEHGMMADASLVEPGEADDAIRQLFEKPQIAYIHAHNAVRGCFAARVERT